MPWTSSPGRAAGCALCASLTELAVTLADQTVTLELLKSIPSVHSQRSFKGDDGHYDLVSAFRSPSAAVMSMRRCIIWRF
ncbi:MAG: hypothetical protein ACLVJ6_02175 [Merdibacter sp.]